MNIDMTIDVNDKSESLREFAAILDIIFNDVEEKERIEGLRRAWAARMAALPGMGLDPSED